MEQPVSRATVIHLEHFPAYEVPTIKKNLVPNIAKYLKGLLSDKLYRDGRYIELPSFSMLCKFFRCRHLEIYDAFKILRTQGYDYQFSSLDGAVMVWKVLSKYGDSK
jgi:hypothetical protein